MHRAVGFAIARQGENLRACDVHLAHLGEHAFKRFVIGLLILAQGVDGIQRFLCGGVRVVDMALDALGAVVQRYQQHVLFNGLKSLLGYIGVHTRRTGPLVKVVNLILQGEKDDDAGSHGKQEQAEDHSERNNELRAYIEVFHGSPFYEQLSQPQTQMIRVIVA